MTIHNFSQKHNNVTLQKLNKSMKTQFLISEIKLPDLTQKN